MLIAYRHCNLQEYDYFFNFFIKKFLDLSILYGIKSDLIMIVLQNSFIFNLGYLIWIVTN